MADEYDVSSKRLTSTGAAGIGRARIRQVVATVSGAGRVTLTSGNGGATKIDLDFAAAGTYDIFTPGTQRQGQSFASDLPGDHGFLLFFFLLAQHQPGPEKLFQAFLRPGRGNTGE